MFLMVISCLNCVGTDYLDDPIIGERIEVSETQVALKRDQSVTLTARFFDKYGIPRNEPITWTSSSPLIAAIDPGGVVKALSPGQAMIVASVGTTESASVNINVVLDETQVALVEVTSPSGKQSLNIGESIQLTVALKNINNEVLTGKTIQWFSENSAIAQVSSTGVVTGVANGIVDIHAKSEGVKSNIVNFSIGGGKSGNFISAGGYKAIGMASLKVVGTNLILELSSNFETSFALGTFVYMANSTNGAQ
jgi:Bacterial Ig-like domain (group 2).